MLNSGLASFQVAVLGWADGKPRPRGGYVVSTAFAIDHAVPGLIVKFGEYPLHHGGVGAIRSLGRLGVPMYAITEDRYTPAASSRYLTRAFVWPTSGAEEPQYLVEGLLRIGRRIGRPTVLVRGA